MNRSAHTERPASGDASERTAASLLIGWLLFPFALFPLAALVSYDWHAITALQSPSAPSSNWLGVMGDAFAYSGYSVFGLAIWAVPFACVIWGFCLVAGRKMRNLRRVMWFFAFMTFASCLIQVAQTHAPGIAAVMQKLNIPHAGGAIGYIVMTRFLSRLLSDVGSSVVMVIGLLVATVGAIGAHNLISFFTTLFRWALNRPAGQPFEPAPDDPTGEEAPAYAAARNAREEARRQREEEKAAARAEKLRIKEEKLREKEEARRRKEEERAARIAEKAAEKAAREFELQQAADHIDSDRGAIPSAPATAPQKPAPQKSVDEAAQTDAQQDKGPYLIPPVSLLSPIPRSTADHGNVEELSRRLVDTLKLFGIDAKLSYTIQGPVVTKFALELAPGTRYSVVSSLSKNIMGALHAKSLRIEEPIPGEDRVGIEVPNKKPAGISFREIFESSAWKNSKAHLPLLFGKDAAGNELIADLAKMPHLLVAGATGQGKSVCLNSLICGLLMTKTPDELKLIMVDPKSVEFTPYSKIPHLLGPVITDNKKVLFSLQWAVVEMEKRLKMFSRVRAKNIEDFNHRKVVTQTDMFGDDKELNPDLPKTVPYIVIIIDEVADLMSVAAKEVTPLIARIAAKARAAGIHLILATQRPDAKVITGTIKSNIPGRVAFKTAQAIDSRTILDAAGAENLIGRGDMLFKGKSEELIRAQGALIPDCDIESITTFIEEHSNLQFDEKFASRLNRIKEVDIEATLDEAVGEEESTESESAGASAREMVKADENADLYKRAIEVIINTNRASVSHFQRKLNIGYNHAARLCDELEENGVVAPHSGAGPRTILMDQQQLLAIMNGGGATEVLASAEGGESAQEPSLALDFGEESGDEF